MAHAFFWLLWNRLWKATLIMAVQCVKAVVGAWDRPLYPWININNGLYSFQNRPIFIKIHKRSDLGAHLTFLLRPTCGNLSCGLKRAEEAAAWENDREDACGTDISICITFFVSYSLLLRLHITSPGYRVTIISRLLENYTWHQLCLHTPRYGCIRALGIETSNKA